MATETVDADALRLAQLGYKQELKRNLHWIHNFGVSFAIISVPTGIAPLFAYSLNNGGPSVLVWGWCIVFAFVMAVASSMSEIVSAFPTSGALYWWSAKLGGPKYGPIASWFTGYFNLFGEVGLVAGVGYSFAVTLASTITLANPDVILSLPSIYGIYVACLVACGLINAFGEKITGHLANVSVALHLIFIFTSTIWLIAASRSKEPQPASWVFGGFANASGFSDIYAGLLGLLTAQWCLSGFDASAHLSEETKDSATGAAKGMLNAVFVSFLVGFFFIVGTLFSITDLDAAAVGGYTAILLENLGEAGAIAISALLCAVIFFCTLSSVLSNSRMIYAFSRDGAMPGSTWIRHIDARTNTPVRAIFVSIILALLLALPSVGSSVALPAITSIGTIGQYLSYASPIFMRITVGQEYFKPGPFTLGKFGVPIGWIAVIWVAFIAVIFCLPTVYPVSAANFNYAPVMVAFVVAFAGIYWLVSARKWYKGPQILVSEDEIMAMEAAADAAKSAPPAPEETAVKV